MSLSLVAETPPLTVDEHGRIRVAGTRVFLEIVVEDYRRGMSAEQIAEQYDTVGLADIYGALRYYLTHRAEVDAYITRQDAEAAEMRRTVEVRQGPQPTREQLLTRRTFRPGDRVPASGLWQCNAGRAMTIALSGGDTFPPCEDGPADAVWGYVPNKSAGRDA